MHGQLVEITTDLRRDGDQLLLQYRPDTLHALRICIRRIRGILKHIGSEKARRYRKSWGGFASLTNDARDWDVLTGMREVC